VGIFSFLKKRKEYFTAQERGRIVEAIRNAEKQTSGEIRVFIETRNRFVNVMDRASEVFFKLKMQETEHRNAVLLYIAMGDRQLALFGDEGIHGQVGETYWKNEVIEMIQRFSKEDVCTGIINCVTHIGQTLKEKFPYEADTDRNEIPDDIVFGQ
jgi:uncharacterized membrane protein